MSSTPAQETPTTCTRCGQVVAEGQRLEHKGAIYCQECVGRTLNGAAAPLRAHSVAKAVLLSLLPGVGQMYNHQLRKGVVVLAAFMVVASGNVLPGGLQAAVLVPLYFWNLFDAYWGARRINQQGLPELPPVGELEVPEVAPVAWGVLLIVLGLLFLLNNFGVVWLTWDRLWPAALLVVGLWLLVNFFLQRGPSPASESEEPRS